MLETCVQRRELSQQDQQRVARALREVNAVLGSQDCAEDDDNAEREVQFQTALMANSQYIEQRARDVENVAVAMYVRMWLYALC
jgi:hypothetical protein